MERNTAPRTNKLTRFVRYWPFVLIAIALIFALVYREIGGVIFAAIVFGIWFFFIRGKKTDFDGRAP